MLTKSSVEGKWQLETSAIYRHVTRDQKTKSKKKKKRVSFLNMAAEVCLVIFYPATMS